MKKKIFLFHGMGAHPEGWHEEVLGKLQELQQRNEYQNLNRSGTRSLNDLVEVIPINYDAKFVELLQKWADDANALGVAGIGPNQVTQLVGWLRGASRDDFPWTHAGDVLLYRIFRLVRDEIKIHCANQLVPHIEGGAEWVVLAHSLGTAVAHDTLDMLWTGRLEDSSPSGFAPRNEQADAIVMIANVSRVVQAQRKVYESTVRPGAAGEVGRGCLRYLNVNHDRDPFTIPKKFDPKDWPEHNNADLYLDVTVDHIHDANIHGFTHYLDHPSVHIPFFRALTFSRVISQDLQADLESAYPRFRGVSDSEGFNMRGLLEDIAPSISDTWERIGEIGRRFDEVLA